jgi:hypothetical protein
MSYDPDNITGNDVSRGMIPSAPRIRVSRSSTLTLTTSWQTLDFNGTSAANVNTFPKDSNNVEMITYDTTAKKFKFSTSVDRNYALVIYIKTTATSILNALNLSMGSLQMRFVVPGGNTDGSDYYFPFPDDGGYIDLNLVNSVSPWQQEYYTNIFVDQRKRTGGMQVQLKLSNTVLGTVTVTASNALFYGR